MASPKIILRQIEIVSSMKLGVNIDHVATLRQARYRGHGAVAPWAEPDIVGALHSVERGGADGITFHLREDRRHIQDADVWTITKHARLPLNLELSTEDDIVRVALKLGPQEACIVPERREEVTTEGGLDVMRGGRRLAKTILSLQKRGIVVSLFIAPDPPQIRAAAAAGATFIELHTGAFAEARSPSRVARELRRLERGAEIAHSLGLRVNAGHGLRYTNVELVRSIPRLVTLNIGHSIVSRAVTVGLEQAVREMRTLIGSA